MLLLRKVVVAPLFVVIVAFWAVLWFLKFSVSLLVTTEVPASLVFSNSRKALLVIAAEPAVLSSPKLTVLPLLISIVASPAVLVFQKTGQVRSRRWSYVGPCPGWQRS